MQSYHAHVWIVALDYSGSLGRAASMITPIFVGFVVNQCASIESAFTSGDVCALLALLIWLMRTRETAGKRPELV